MKEIVLSQVMCLRGPARIKIIDGANSISAKDVNESHMLRCYGSRFFAAPQALACHEVSLNTELFAVQTILFRNEVGRKSEAWKYHKEQWAHSYVDEVQRAQEQMESKDMINDKGGGIPQEKERGFFATFIDSIKQSLSTCTSYFSDIMSVHMNMWA